MWCFSLTSTCASCHSTVHFLTSQLSKVLASELRRFEHRRSQLFEHLNFQKCSEHGVFLYILTSKSALRHNGMQLFISHLPRWLRTHRFSEPTFRPSGAPKHWKKKSVSRCFYLFAHLHLLSSDSFSSLIFFLLFSSLLFSSLLFSSLLKLSYRFPIFISK